MEKMEYLDDFITERIEIAMRELRNEEEYALKYKEHLELLENTFAKIEDDEVKTMVRMLFESYNLTYSDQLDKAYHAGATDLVKLLKHYGVL